MADWLQRDDRGAFRAWLFRIAKNTTIDFLTRRKHKPWAAGGDTAEQQFGDVEASPDVSSHFDLEYRREIFQRASETVRSQVTENTWHAFHKTSVLEQSIETTAQQLGMTTGSVYIARSRVMKRLQQIVKTLAEFSDDEL